MINPLGNLQRKLEAQKAIQPFLSSKPFLEWTSQLSKQSLLKRANQVDLRKLNDTAPVTDSNPINTFLQNILGQFTNTSQNNTSSNGVGDAFQNLFNGVLGSLSAGGDQAKASNGSQNGSPAGSFGNFLQNITQNTNGIGNLITSMLGANGGKGGATSGMNLGNILQLLSGGNVDPSTIGNILMSFLNGAVQGTNASTACQGDFIKVIKGLQNMEAWALKFLDASAKIPTDLLNLNLNWYGSYDECYSDSTFLESFGILHNTQTPVKGQYCNTNLNLPLPPEVKGILMVALQNSGYIKAGICFPKSCSTDDLLQIVNAFLNSIPLGDNKVTAWPITCPVPAEEDTLETDTIVVVYPENKYKLRAENGDIQHTQPVDKHAQKPGIVGRLVLCFSAYTNGKKILGTSQPKGSLTAVNGIRFLSMSWVILANMLQYYNEFGSRAASQAIFNAPFSVDSFFVLSRAAYFEDYYIVPYCRMGPYICGVITGYILYKTKCKCRMNIFVNLLGWAVATATACGCLYGIYNTVRPDNPVYLSKEVTALYNGVSRTAWGAAVCWVIFACSTGNGGFINTLLSWKAFVPLSRLTYCAYLVHPLVMYVYYFNWNFPLYMTDLDLVYLFLGNLVVSYGIAFIVSIAFESPFMGLEKIMFGGLGKKKK
uniref:Nose resistant to fluoxetine protein 6 n=1 Tax=Magallana gigas TaxID=29159 RepID=K1PPN2_MAGGI